MSSQVKKSGQCQLQDKKQQYFSIVSLATDSVIVDYNVFMYYTNKVISAFSDNMFFSFKCTTNSCNDVTFRLSATFCLFIFFISFLNLINFSLMWSQCLLALRGLLKCFCNFDLLGVEGNADNDV
jgi:hypothetical protein